MPPKFGGGVQCARCTKTVYMAEQIPGPGGFWHKQCLACKECNRKLDSTNLTERDSEAYCKTCYGKLFGPKGYGYGNTLSTDSTITDQQRYTANSADIITRNLTSMQSSTIESNSFLGGSQTSHKFSPQLAEEKAKLSTPAVVSGGCPRCGKQVYFAEQILGPGGVKYHKQCFRCTECGKSLDATTMAEKDSVLFCKACHGKKFGPKGYGYGVGAGTLTNTQ